MHGNRIHKLDAPVGNLQVDYAATIVGRTDPAPVTEYDLSMYLRPSRYAEADKFYGFAATEFGNYIDSATLLEKVSSWVGTRLNYVPGSSDPIDGAVDTLLAGAGVCRDFAHLVVALLRAVNVPARVVSVYAPGLYPMDFHAVAEAFVEGQWRVVDGTLLGAAAVAGAHRHRTRRRRHRLPGQPQGCDQTEQVRGHRDCRRRPSHGLGRRAGVDRLSTHPPDRVRVGIVAVLKRQDAGIENDAVADLDRPGDRRGRIPRRRPGQNGFDVGQQRLADLPGRRVPQVGRAVVHGVVVHAVRHLDHRLR